LATEFSCNTCGKILLTNDPPGSRVVCPTCSAENIVQDSSQPGGPAPGTQNAAAAPPHEPEPISEPSGGEEPLSERTVRVLNAVVPWVVSVVFHAGIFLILFFFFVAKEIVGSGAEADRIIIPDARLSENPGGVIDTSNQGTGLQTGQPGRQAKAHEFKRLPTKDMLSGVGGGGTGGGDGTPGDLKIIGIGAGSGGGPGSGYGLSTGDGGQGPRSSFYGAGGNAYKICYVIDRSGSLLDTFEYLRASLKKSIRDLVPQQQFHVIFFAAGKPQELPAGRLIYATQKNKEDACKYLDTVSPEGQTQPEAALERAFACKPDLIYFMTDGDFDAKVVDLLARINKNKKVKINTYSYLHKPGEALLKQIAREHGGRYKHVTEDDFDQ